MRASLIIVILSFVCFSGTGQKRKTDRVSGHFENMTLEHILDSISAQTGYFFSYNSEILPKGSLYTISAENMQIDEFLSQLLVGTKLNYSFFKDQVILNYEPPSQFVPKKKDFFTISGTVYDEDGRPLHGANVFLDGTTIGVSSDIDGNYKLESIPPGTFEIVFSYVGYLNGVYQISEYDGDARIQNHQMELDTEQLAEVEVISQRVNRSDNDWITYYAIFREELLGLTANAAQCVIENPQVLNFTYQEDMLQLRAFAKGPLIIRNDALGYRISYLLESFEKNGADLRYRGKIQFRNMQPVSGRERREWKKNRKIAYYGSFKHFKKALLKNKLIEEGFRMYLLKDIDQFKVDKSMEVSALDVLVYKGDHYELDFKNYLIVEYRKEKESLDFLSKSNFAPLIHQRNVVGDSLLVTYPGNQLSAIKLLRGATKLDENGQVLDRFAISTFGYWSWERLADLVPLNYDPKNDNF